MLGGIKQTGGWPRYRDNIHEGIGEHCLPTHESGSIFVLDNLLVLGIGNYHVSPHDWLFGLVRLWGPLGRYIVVSFSEIIN